MFEKLSSISSDITITSIPKNPRGCKAIELYSEVDEEIRENFSYEEDPILAYRKVLEKNKKITVCCGSFYILIKLKEGLNEKK